MPRKRPRPRRRCGRLHRHAGRRGLRRETGGRPVAGFRAGKVPVPGSPGAMGGAKALQAVGAAAKDADARVAGRRQPAAGRVDVAGCGPRAADLAKTAADAKYKIRALRGYLRLARQFSMPDPERAQMCRAAMALPQRDAEKKLVLEVLGHLPEPRRPPPGPGGGQDPRAEERRHRRGDDSSPRRSAASRPNCRSCSAEMGHVPVQGRDPQGRIRRRQTGQGRDRLPAEARPRLPA